MKGGDMTRKKQTKQSDLEVQEQKADEVKGGSRGSTADKGPERRYYAGDKPAGKKI
jgi:hypothetical protein